MNNMAVEDILDELGGYGSVTLRRTKFPISASHFGNSSGKYPKEKWHLEVSLPGYSGKNLNAYVTAEGSTIREVAEAAYAALESYIFSPTAREDRERYISQHAFYQERYDKANAHQRSGHDPIRPPDRFKPPIVWGQPRSWETEIATRDVASRKSPVLSTGQTP